MPLAVRVGPGYTQQTLISVNDDQHPVLIDSEYFTGRVVVRIRHFTGITPAGEPRIENTKYFDSRRRKFSIQVEGRFKQPVSADEVYYGVDFDDIPPIPRVFDIGMAAARLIDPAVYYNSEAEKPYIMSPMLCGINAFNIRDAPEMCQEQELYCAQQGEESDHEETVDEDGDIFYDATDTFSDRPSSDHLYAPAQPSSVTGIPPLSKRVSWPSSLNAPMGGRPRRGTEANLMMPPSFMMTEMSSSRDIGLQLFNVLPLAEYRLGNERALEEDTHLQLAGVGCKDPNGVMSYKERRKYFLNQSNRQNFMFTPDKQYGFDFYSPHMDFNTFQLRLGMSIKVDKYLGGRPIRYVCRSLNGRITYFVITFNLEN